MEWNARTTTIAIARKLLRATLDRAVGITAPTPIGAGGMAAHWRDWPPMKLALRPHQIALDCYPIIPLRGMCHWPIAAFDRRLDRPLFGLLSCEMTRLISRNGHIMGRLSRGGRVWGAR